MFFPDAETLARKIPFYYGWLIVAGFFISGMAAGGPLVFGFSVFIVPMEEDLGWSRATLLLPLTMSLIFLAVLSPIFQRLMDHKRWPPIILTTSSVLLASGMILNSLAKEPWHFMISFGLVSGVGFAFAGGFAHLALVPKWFIKRRARAIAMGSMGTAVSAMIYPLFAEFMISSFGWRTAWVALGSTSLILLVPISLLVRRAPEDLGLLPDGEIKPNKDNKSATTPESTIGSTATEYSYSPKEVMKYRTTWLIVAVMVVTAPTLVGLTSNWAPHFRDIGLSSTVAASVITTYGVFSIISRFLWGYLVERYHVRSISIIQALVTAIAIVVLLQARTSSWALVYGALQGITLGGALALQPLLWANYYGRKHLGAILGAFQPFTSLAMAVRPVGIGLLRDYFGAYQSVFIALLVSWLIAACLIYLIRPLPIPTDHDKN